jgi:hypothetical protein
MSDAAADRATVILSRWWRRHESELSFVTRAVAGAASRTSAVVVVVPSPAGAPEPDGAFDLFAAGAGPDGSWPEAATAAWPDQLPPDATLVVDQPVRAALTLLERYAPGRPVHSISPLEGQVGPDAMVPLRFTGSPGDQAGQPDFIRLHVPINPLAATHRHNGLGFTDYLLVLSDRTGATAPAPPTAMVAWLTARFPDRDVVVVEDAVASVWRGRVLRGTVSVYTRLDLWRLMAHARVTVDLAPGSIVARECVESLRFGTPILVPAGSAAGPHATAGGGLTFAGATDLLEGVRHLLDDAARATVAERGRRYADAHYGDRDAFVQSVALALGRAVASDR